MTSRFRSTLIVSGSAALLLIVCTYIFRQELHFLIIDYIPTFRFSDQEARRFAERTMNNKRIVYLASKDLYLDGGSRSFVSSHILLNTLHGDLAEQRLKYVLDDRNADKSSKAEAAFIYWKRFGSLDALRVVYEIASEEPALTPRRVIALARRKVAWILTDETAAQIEIDPTKSFGVDWDQFLKSASENHTPQGAGG